MSTTNALLLGAIVFLFLIMIGITAYGYFYITALKTQIQSLIQKEDNMSSSLNDYLDKMSDVVDRQAEKICYLEDVLKKESQNRVVADKELVKYVDASVKSASANLASSIRHQMNSIDWIETARVYGGK